MTSSGNPIELDLKSRYVVKGLGKEQIIDSKVKIWTEGDKIVKVHDEWNGKLPESDIAQVSRKYLPLISPWWWHALAEGWAFWGWSFAWGTRPWRVRWPFSTQLARSLCLGLGVLQRWCKSRFEIHADLSSITGLPETECELGAFDGECAEECGGGCKEGKLERCKLLYHQTNGMMIDDIRLDALSNHVNAPDWQMDLNLPLLASLALVFSLLMAASQPLFRRFRRPRRSSKGRDLSNTTASIRESSSLNCPCNTVANISTSRLSIPLLLLMPRRSNL